MDDDAATNTSPRFLSSDHKVRERIDMTNGSNSPIPNSYSSQ